MSKDTKDSYRGVRDFYPKDMFVQNYIFEVMRRVCESFGYVEYNASILEPTDLYTGKTSEEILAEQTYTFEDRGGRSVTLRPEMTPTVSRMVATRHRELPFPLRWYSIGNMFRYERPQKGRIREHWQLNADLFGTSDESADVELLSLAHALLLEYGATEEQFIIRINDRSLLNEFVASFDLSREDTKKLIQLIDKKERVDDFEKAAYAIAGKEVVFSNTANERLGEVRETLSSVGISNVVFDPSLARGFDYYTGIVFEVFDTNPESKRSLFGGGRYDNLIEHFGGPRTPAIGFGMGDVTIRDFLADKDLLPPYTPPIDLFVQPVGTAEGSQILALAARLRSRGISVSVGFKGSKKLDTVLKNVSRQAIPFFVAVGENELGTGTYTLRDMKKGSVVKEGFSEDTLVDTIFESQLE